MNEQAMAQILLQEDSTHVWYLGGLLSIKRVGDSQSGFAFIDELLPVGFGTPYHLHHNEDESFYVLEGTIEFIVDGRRVVGTAGTLVHLPKHVPHGFRVVGESNARVFNLLHPFGMEQMFVDIGEMATSLTLPEPVAPDVPKIIEIAKRYSVETLGPLDLFVKE